MQAQSSAEGRSAVKAVSILWAVRVSLGPLWSPTCRCTLLDNDLHLDLDLDLDMKPCPNRVGYLGGVIEARYKAAYDVPPAQNVMPQADLVLMLSLLQNVLSPSVARGAGSLGVHDPRVMKASP